jgi:transcriptional regulator with XRE-family HTH domain
MSSIGQDFASQLRARRREEGMSLRELAEASGVSFSTISRIERGHFTPTYDNAVRLARTLGMRLEGSNVSPQVGDRDASPIQAEQGGGREIGFITVVDLHRQSISAGRRRNLSKTSLSFDSVIVLEGVLLLQSTGRPRRKVEAGAVFDCIFLRQQVFWALAMTDSELLWVKNHV